MKLSLDNYKKVKLLFDCFHHHLSVRGVITGDVPGDVYLSDDANTAVLMNTAGIFVAGSPHNDSFFQQMNQLFTQELMPKLAAEEELDYVLFHPLQPEWEDTLRFMMKDLYPMKCGRMTFTHDMQRVEPLLDEDIVPVDAALARAP